MNDALDRGDLARETDEAALRDQVSRAASESALGRATRASTPAEVFLAATGGWLGIIEALAPPMLFLIAFVLTEDLWLSVIAPVVLGVLFIAVRAARSQAVSSAIGGLIAVALSGFLALRSGQGSDFFLIGFWTNAAYLVAFIVSILLRWPLIGVVAGFALNQGTAWRRERKLFWSMQAITGCWAALFAVRLLVQVPLYMAENTQGLGIARMLMGPPLFGIVAVFTVLFVRGVYRPELSELAAESRDPSAH